jgi:hypothetical protein
LAFKIKSLFEKLERIFPAALLVFSPAHHGSPTPFLWKFLNRPNCSPASAAQSIPSRPTRGFLLPRSCPSRHLLWPAPPCRAPPATSSTRDRTLLGLLLLSSPSPGSAPSFPLPLGAESKPKPSCLEATPSRRRLLPDHLRSLVSGPIKCTGTPSHLTHSSFRYSFLPSRLHSTCPSTTVHHRHHSSSPSQLRHRTAHPHPR